LIKCSSQLELATLEEIVALQPESLFFSEIFIACIKSQKFINSSPSFCHSSENFLNEKMSKKKETFAEIVTNWREASWDSQSMAWW
jgi:hypothetical protein